ncbi:polysaccharide deacetylase family protein [Halocatena marina]|nr:polysaccharide deacetylase family protein [Halocatena marina]
MRKQSTRRTFLATVGVVGVTSFAGCSSLSGGEDAASPTPGNKTGTPAPTKSTKSQKKTKTTANSKGGTGGSQGPGTSIDAFDDLSQWEVDYGKVTTIKQDSFQGGQSVSLEPKKSGDEPIARIKRSFYPKTLDLSKHDLSLAAKVNDPDGIKVRAEVIAPAESSMLTAVRRIPRDLGDWVRFDLGYTASNGTPVMDKVTEIRLQIGPLQDATDFQVLIDDLRKVPKSTKGKVMFQFDDGHVSAYETAYPILKEKDWPGSVAVIPEIIGKDVRVDEPMMREMGKSGWDMMVHSGEPLPEHSEKQQRKILQSSQQALELLGFKKGARHIVAPYNRMNKTTLRLVDELFETGYLQGGCPNNARHPSNPNFISRVDGDDIRGTKRALDTAAKFNQLAVVYFHVIGDDGLPVSKFEEIINYVEETDLEVITPSQLVDGDNY